MSFDPADLSRVAPLDSATAFVRGPDEGVAIELPNWTMSIKVGPNDSGGRLTVPEGRRAAEHGGPPAHVHHGHDETFVVLGGRLRFRLGDAFHAAVPGETVFASRRSARGFSNRFADEAHSVALIAPSGYEGYFHELASYVAPNTGALPGADVMADLMARYQTELVTPLPDPGGASSSAS